MSKVFELCRTIAAHDPEAVVGSMLGVEIPEGHGDACALIVEALADAAPGEFVKVVGAYLYESEVA